MHPQQIGLKGGTDQFNFNRDGRAKLTLNKGSITDNEYKISKEKKYILKV